MITTLHEALTEIKRSGMRPVRAVVDGIEVEVRPVARDAAGPNAGSVFAALGPWEGDSLDEVQSWLAEAREAGARRSVPQL